MSPVFCIHLLGYLKLCLLGTPQQKTPEVLPAARVLTRNAGTISDAPVGRPFENAQNRMVMTKMMSSWGL